jgi:hypothetical protein
MSALPLCPLPNLNLRQSQDCEPELPLLEQGGSPALGIKNWGGFSIPVCLLAYLSAEVNFDLLIDFQACVCFVIAAVPQYF